ncbi:kinase-like protein [Coprinopsis marcescibilis]|uniref:Kinase-like protein n=1 Tax=Coprinopsis marcescibilis TaxID=230819 RepID=A0A5C3L2X3_COPMA|nr:kinase-like protein [Coprinopsis marcescibilis]
MPLAMASAGERQHNFDESLSNLLNPGSLRKPLDMLTLVDLIESHGHRSLDLETRMRILTGINLGASAEYFAAWASSTPAMRLVRDWLRDALNPLKSQLKPTLLLLLQLLQSLPTTDRLLENRDLHDLVRDAIIDGSSREVVASANRLFEQWNRSFQNSPHLRSQNAPKWVKRRGFEANKLLGLETNRDGNVDSSPPSPSQGAPSQALHQLSDLQAQDLPEYMEAAVRLARNEGFQWTEHTAGLQILYEVLKQVVYTKELYQHVLSMQGESSQLVLDSLQLLLNYPSCITVTDRGHFVTALIRLSNRTDLYPTCLALKEVELARHPFAAGSFGDVYRGTFQGQYVAVKVRKLYATSEVSNAIKSVSKEAIIWSQLSHRNLLPFYGVYHMDDAYNRICMVSPWMDNGNVSDYLKSHSSSNRILLIADVVSGIQYLHENGIIHGDLKAVNILVTQSGHACLADFGLSKVSECSALSWTSIRDTSTSSGGSIRWQAPELFDPEDESSPLTMKCDIYSFSCVCYEIMTGRVPFYEYTRDATVMMKVMAGLKPSKPTPQDDAYKQFGLTEAIWGLITECWHENPAMRPDAADIVRCGVLSSQHDPRPDFDWNNTSRFRVAMTILS